jgi:hypothetical protein
MDAPFKLDPHQQLIWNSEVACAVLGSQSQPDRFLIVPLPMPEAMTGVLAVAKVIRDYAYAGSLAYNAGESSAIAEPGMERTMMHAALVFARYVADELSARGDSVGWCESLMRLEDSRA